MRERESEREGREQHRKEMCGGKEGEAGEEGVNPKGQANSHSLLWIKLPRSLFFAAHVRGRLLQGARTERGDED